MGTHVSVAQRINSAIFLGSEISNPFHAVDVKEGVFVAVYQDMN